MTGPERGFLLLCSHLGDPERKCLTTAQFRKLTRRVRQSEMIPSDRDLESGDLTSLGYSHEEAQRIVDLLSEEERLDHYLRRAERAGCHVLTLFSGRYPKPLEQRLGDDAPAVLWYRGDPTILERDGIGLAGSRDLLPENAAFAREAGVQAARQNLTLISGNARGADRTAQQGCLESGGSVIAILADSLKTHAPEENCLFLCEDSFDLPFSPIRALSRNRLIHSMGIATLIAQSTLNRGGTWDGSVKNLRFGWTELFCFDDRRESTGRLHQMGAELISLSDLSDLRSLPAQPRKLI